MVEIVKELRYILGIALLITMAAVTGYAVATYMPEEQIETNPRYVGGAEVFVNIEYTVPETEEAEIHTGVKVIEKTYMGEYKLTAYCPCEKCCGTNTGITATGTHATQGRTIGVNPDEIPYGSIIEINGERYVAEDTGSGIGSKHIDIFFDEHEDALAFGTQRADVFIVNEYYEGEKEEEE